MFKYAVLVLAISSQSSLAFLNGGWSSRVSPSFSPLRNNKKSASNDRISNSILFLDSDSQADDVAASSEYSCDVLVLGSGPAARAGKKRSTRTVLRDFVFVTLNN